MALELFPNPAQQAATLSYYLSAAAIVSVQVMDVLSRPVADVTSTQRQAAGLHTQALPISQLPEGVYWVRVQHDGVITTRKLLVAH